MRFVGDGILVDLRPPGIEFIDHRVSIWIICRETFFAAFWFCSCHSHIAVGSEIPHAEFSEKLVGITCRVGSLPPAFLERTLILAIEPGPHPRCDAVIAEGMSELVNADIPSTIAINRQPQKILFATRNQAPAHAPCPLISGQAAVLGQRFSLVVLPFRQVGGDLIAANNMEFYSGLGEI